MMLLLIYIGMMLLFMLSFKLQVKYDDFAPIEDRGQLINYLLILFTPFLNLFVGVVYTFDIVFKYTEKVIWPKWKLWCSKPIRSTRNCKRKKDKTP